MGNISNVDLAKRFNEKVRKYCGLSDSELLDSPNYPQSVLPNDGSDECKRTAAMFQQNNGDKLRSMTNEQLARYLWIETDRMTPEEWLDWLNAT